MREMFHVKHGEKAMEKNKTYRAEITGLTAEGAGVARIDGQVVFVPGVIPGETCEIKIDHVGRTCAYGSLVRVMEASPHRVEPECPYFGRCGGCVFWHMDYACELEQKKRRVQDALSRIGGVEFPDLQITGSRSVYGYRNKVQFPVQGAKRQAGCGLLSGRQPCSHCHHRLQNSAGKRQSGARSGASLDGKRKYCGV